MEHFGPCGFFFSPTPVLDLRCLQVVWPSSETDINCKDQSGLAFEDFFHILLCKPAEMCCFFHVSSPSVSPKGKGRGLHMAGAIDAGCKFISINFYIFVLGNRTPLYCLILTLFQQGFL